MAIVISGNGIDMGGNPVSNASQVHSSLINASQIDSTVINENGSNVISQGELAYDVDTSSYIPNTLASGAIIERGSNANGEYIKYADGTLICTRVSIETDQAIKTTYGSNLFNGNRFWTFPFAFVNNPSCSGSIVWGSSASWTITASTYSTSVAFLVLDVSSRETGTNTKINFLAIGKWK